MHPASSAALDPCLARPMASWTEALDLRAVADAHGTPLYLHHPPSLERAFADYAAIVGPAGVRYPVKANPSPLVLEALARWGGGADCASRPEVHAALAAGEHQRYTAHGDPRSQFGVPSEELVAVLAANAPPVTGLHVHVGTMMDNLAAFTDGLAFLHELADRVAAQTAHRRGGD